MSGFIRFALALSFALGFVALARGETPTVGEGGERAEQPLPPGLLTSMAGDVQRAFARAATRVRFGSLTHAPPSPLDLPTWEPPPPELMGSATDSRIIPRRVLTAAELFAIVGGAGVDYWRRTSVAPLGWSSWVERFSSTEWLILDTSTFSTNYGGHTVGGASYHLSARTNDLGLLESAAWNLGASLVWEYVVEYRQKVDLNDLIFTTPAGIAAGEFMHRLGNLVHQRGEGRGWDVARWTLGFPQSFNEALGGERLPTPEVSGAFEIAAGAGSAGATAQAGDDLRRGRGSIGHLRLQGELAALGAADRPGATWQGFRDGNLTSIEVLMTGGPGGQSGVFFLNDTVLAGWQYRERAADKRRGHELTLGTSVAVRYQRERYGEWNDRIGMAHLPGLAADAKIVRPGWRLEGKARLHADYGGVHAAAKNAWNSAHPDEVGLSAVEEEGYYHAYGASGRLGAALTVPHLQLGGDVFLARYRAHHARDKLRDAVTVKQDITTRALDYGLWLRLKLPGQLFALLRVDTRHRLELLDEFDTRSHLRRYLLELGAAF